MLGRRALGVGALGLIVSGCGFHPLYERSASGGAGPTSRELAAVSVEIIPDRPGQLLRQELQQRLEGAGDGPPRRYSLAVDYGISGEGIAVLQNNTVTRLRLIGRAQWTLRAEDVDRTVLTRDVARSVDDINVINEQYFFVDLATEAAQKRIASTIADQIVLQLGSYFTRRADRPSASG